MNKQVKIVSILALILIFTLSLLPDVSAQCPMCRMAVESNLQNGGSAGKGLNFGILLLLSTPYLIIGSIAYIWWKNRKKAGEEVELEA